MIFLCLCFLVFAALASSAFGRALGSRAEDYAVAANEKAPPLTVPLVKLMERTDSDPALATRARMISGARRK